MSEITYLCEKHWEFIMLLDETTILQHSCAVCELQAKLDLLERGRASLTDFVNSWCRESCVEEALAPFLIKPAVDRLWSRLSTQIHQLQEKLARAEAALQHIGEYWNGSENERAMRDALREIEETISAYNTAEPKEKP